MAKHAWLSCLVSLTLMAFAGTAGAEDADIALKVQNAPVSPASMGALFRLGTTTKNPQLAQYLFRAAGAGLMSISREDIYVRQVRHQITDADEFESALMATCPKCASGTPSCTTCGGSGQCRTCGGRGHFAVQLITHTGTRPCATCGGSGSCPACKGKGTAICTRCRGSRKVLLRDKAKDVYKDSLAQAIDIYSHGETVRVFQYKEYSLEEALDHSISVILQAARKERIKSIVTTGFLWNGQRNQNLGSYYENKCSMTLVNEASDIDIMDRSDLKNTLKELELSRFLSGQDDVKDLLSTVLMGADAFLMGELMYDKAYCQALFSLRLIDTRTAKVLAATADVVKIDTSLCSRLGMNISTIRSQPNMAMMVPGNPDKDRCVRNMKSVDSVVFAALEDIPADKRLSARIFYAQLAAEIVQGGVHLIEREFLYDIIKEKELVDREISELASAGWLLVSNCDLTSQDKAGITFFVTAMTVKGSVRKGMFEAKLLSPAK